MKKLLLITALLSTFATTSFAHDGHHTITVSDAWAKPSMEGKNLSAAFFNVKNDGDKKIILKSTASESW